MALSGFALVSRFFWVFGGKTCKGFQSMSTGATQSSQKTLCGSKYAFLLQLLTAEFGANRRLSDVRFHVAIRGKADMPS
jgi:hypothetical protein